MPIRDLNGNRVTTPPDKTMEDLVGDLARQMVRDRAESGHAVAGGALQPGPVYENVDYAHPMQNSRQPIGASPNGIGQAAQPYRSPYEMANSLSDAIRRGLLDPYARRPQERVTELGRERIEELRRMLETTPSVDVYGPGSRIEDPSALRELLNAARNTPAAPQAPKPEPKVEESTVREYSRQLDID